MRLKDAQRQVLLLKRKGDRLLPFARLANGLEVPACVEAEDAVKAETHDATTNSLPSQFNRGAGGRILFENGKIIVVLHLCFYGEGFADLFKALRNDRQNALIKSPLLSDWLVTKKAAIDQAIAAETTKAATDKNPNLSQYLKDNFVVDAVQQQWRDEV